MWEGGGVRSEEVRARWGRVGGVGEGGGGGGGGGTERQCGVQGWGPLSPWGPALINGTGGPSKTALPADTARQRSKNNQPGSAGFPVWAHCCCAQNQNQRPLTHQHQQDEKQHTLTDNNHPQLWEASTSWQLCPDSWGKSSSRSHDKVQWIIDSILNNKYNID